jgi:hypothetical protein
MSTSPTAGYHNLIYASEACWTVLEFQNNLWGAGNRVEIELSYQPARLYRLAESIPWKLVDCAGIFKKSIGARNRVGIGLSCGPAKLHCLAELVPWNRYLGFLKV